MNPETWRFPPTTAISLASARPNAKGGAVSFDEDNARFANTTGPKSYFVSDGIQKESRAKKI